MTTRAKPAPRVLSERQSRALSNLASLGSMVPIRECRYPRLLVTLAEAGLVHITVEITKEGRERLAARRER